MSRLLKILFLITVIVSFISLSGILAQAPPPPPPPPDGGDTPVGGNLPLNNGVYFFFAFAAAYISYHVIRIKRLAKM